ncbi:RNA helicase [Acinetobacter pittii]|uniref:RNA helicase n=1 Tax=Acinetobacter pittii TaxID=48296 RepID=A0A3G6YI63_ACIPI|nr:RNA helicase [Acinetobacter pittii]
MPIAGMGPDYPADHWVDVIKILHTAIERAGFIPRIVSDSEESTVIHGSIINNIYNDAIVVCDVSNKNANVMFELGMRLAFNKPVVIVKDDKTDYSFDTGNIQHENYRKDLRHNTVEKFINDLSRKIKKTYEASLNADYQSFLSYFGKFEVAKIENKSIGESEAIEKLLNKMNSMESKINSLIPKDDEGVTYVSTNRVVDKKTKYRSSITQ